MLFRHFCRLITCCFAVCCTVTTSLVWAGVPAEQILPASTKGLVLIPSWEELENSFNKTQLGQLVQDPVMQPFIEDFKAQMQQKSNHPLERLGITFDDLRSLPKGEIALGVILVNPTTAARFAIIDVEGNEAKAVTLRDRIQKNLVAEGGQVLPTGNDIQRIQLASKPGETTKRITSNLLKKQKLILSDNYEVVTQLSAALDQPRADQLSKVAAYTSIQARLANKAGDLVPHVRWYLEPFGYADAMRIYNPLTEQQLRSTDMLKLLRNQGFTAVQGLGGVVNFSTGAHELLHRTFVYAPGNQSAPAADRFNLGARLLDFPATLDLHVQSWIPREIATYTTFNWNLRERFPAVETLADEYIGEKGSFKDILDSIQNDPDGPKVALQRDVIENLGRRFTVMTDYQLPITVKSERLLFAIEIDTKKNNQPEQIIAGCIERMMKNDESKQRVEHKGIVIWNTVEKKTELNNDLANLDITVEGSNTNINLQPAAYQVPRARPGVSRTRPGQKKPLKNEEQQEKMMPNSAVAVAHGHLYIASNIDILIKVLDHASQVKAQQGAGLINVARPSPSLDSSADLLSVLVEMEQGFGVKDIAMRNFSRTDEEYRPTYELMRNGEMPKSETMFGKLLNGMLNDGKNNGTRQQKLDCSKLPAFEVTRRYLGPAGSFMTVENDGWVITGFTLRKHLNAAKVNVNVQR